MAIQILQFKTYMAMLAGSEGTHMFRRLWADVDGKEVDLVEDGTIACAFFASSILLRFGLIKEPRATVKGLIRDLESSGWQKTDTMRPGCVLVWEEAQEADGNPHMHAGFYLGNGQAISHSDKERTPIVHDVTFGDTRKIIAVYTHEFLNGK